MARHRKSFSPWLLMPIVALSLFDDRAYELVSQHPYFAGAAGCVVIAGSLAYAIFDARRERRTLLADSEKVQSPPIHQLPPALS